MMHEYYTSPALDAEPYLDDVVAALKLLFPASRQECAKQPQGAYRRMCAYRNIYVWGAQFFYIGEDDSELGGRTPGEDVPGKASPGGAAAGRVLLRTAV